MRRFIYTTVALLLFLSAAYAQENKNDQWMFPSRDNNFYDIQKSFNDYWNDKNITFDTPKEDRLGWKQFKRWEWFWEQRVYPSGEFPPRGLVYEEYLKYNKKNKNNKDNETKNSDWQFLGPNSAPGGYEGMGRLNCVIEHPNYNGTTNQTIWVGAASGGIWKTTNDGDTWTSNTDELAVLGMGDIVIDPNDSDIMYAATGDGDGYDTYSVGVLKSTDGGSTWNVTGFQRDVQNKWVCKRMVMNPDDSDELYVATNGGLYRTTDAGTNWSQVLSGIVYDVKYHPTDSDIIYAAKGNEFYRSTDGGSNFTYITSGLPTNSARYCIALTPAEEDYVYLLSTNSSRAFNGVYRSTNAGLSFSTRSTTPNLLNSSFDGSGTGGQGNYDLSMAIDPDDAETIIVGGVNLWKSTDGGANWSIKGYWTSSSVEEVHADHHMLYWPVDNRLYSAHDGGMDISTDAGESWEYIGSGLKITQFYRISVSQTNADLVLCGAQDNSSFLKTSTTFGMTRATGDGMEQAINPEDEDIMYTASYFGKIYKSTNGGDSWFISNYPDEDGAWVTPYQIDPNNSDQLFAGYLEVWKSTNSGVNWTAISNFTNTTVLTVLHVAPENSDNIFVGRAGAFWKTTNGGTSWASLTIPSSNTIKSIVTNPDDADEVWICFSGYTSGEKVYHSTNGGTNWTNISGTLPNVPCNVVIYQEDVDDRIWVGTDIGVWFRGDDDTDWQDYNDELPNVICNDLEIYRAGDKLRLGTYGRGLWEVDLPTNRPGTPELSSPSDEATGQATTLTLSWNSVNDIDSYDLQVSTNESFSTTIVDINTTSTSYEVSGLDFNEEYFWRVRSVDGDIESLWSDIWSFTTEPDPDSCELLFEGFEDISIPSGWTLEYIDDTIDWVFGVSGGYDGNPASAYDGDYNARFFYWDYDVSTQLITPLIEIGNCSDNLMLEFYEARVNYYSDIDELHIKYKYADDADWTLLESFTEEAAAWTLREIDLSSISDDFYICFEAYGNYGYGACIDNVYIYGSGTSEELAAPTLVSPSDNATNQNTSLTLDWNSVSGATGYDVQLSTSSNFTSTIFDASTTETEYSVSGLDESTEYFWRVRATNDDTESDWSSVWSFTTLIPTLDAPDLVSPTDNATDQNTSLTLDWNSVTGATEYDIQLSTTSNFTSTIFDASTTGTEYSVSGLDESTEYFWRVRATNDDTESDWSQVWSFTTLIPTLDTPDLVSPTDNATDQNTSLTLDWNSITGATGYDVQVSTSSNFTTTIVNTSTANTDHDVIGLDESTEYFWRVRATNDDTESGWSQVWSFTTLIPTIDAPDLVSPTDNSTDQNTSLTLDWNSVTGATSYDVQVSTSTNFTTTIVNTSTANTDYDVSGLNENTEYFWRVRAVNNDTESDWSQVWSFETGETQIQECPWTYTDETGSNATIVVPLSIEPTIGNRNIADGDAIGAFFTDGDEQICAGFAVWDGNNMGITVWGDNTYTDEKDGYANSEDYILKAWDAQNGETLDGIFTVYSGPDNFSSDAITYLASFTTASDQTLSIDLSSGWSMISSYIEPEDNDIETMLADIEANVLILKDGAGNIYMPSLNINNINNWSMDKGYKIYMTSSSTLDITGQLIDPTSYTYELGTGWHLISYIRNSSIDIEDALDDIAANMLICKNAQGNLYMPSLNINNINQMQPGEGYQIYMTSYDELTYPDNGSPRKVNNEDRMLTPQPELIFPDASCTGQNMSLVILSDDIEDGNEVGIWTSDNVLAGSGKVHNGKAAITIWGDNEQTEEIDGAGNFEDLKAKVFDKESGISYEILLENIHSLLSDNSFENLEYLSEDIILAKAITQSSTINDDVLLSCKPNPTTGQTVIEYSVQSDGFVSIKLYSMTGQLIQILSESESTAGLHTINFDGSKLTNGVYNIQMIVNDRQVNRLLVISK